MSMKLNHRKRIGVGIKRVMERARCHHMLGSDASISSHHLYSAPELGEE